MGIRNFVLTLLLISALAAAISGCANALTTPAESHPTDQSHTPQPSEREESPAPQENKPSDTPSINTPDVVERSPTQTLPGGLELVETSPVKPVTGEIPKEILDDIFADLIKRTGAERGKIQIMRVESVVWNDGSLGCPQPDEFYIQMMINGYMVVLQVEGVYYDYRVSDRGYFFLCEEEGSLPISPPEEGSPIDNPLVVQAKNDLAERLDISVEEIELLSFEAIVWPDASLGCPQPGMAYIQVPTPGYLVRLESSDQIYEYQTDKVDKVILCDSSMEENFPRIGADKSVDDGWPNQTKDRDVIIVTPTIKP